LHGSKRTIFPARSPPVSGKRLTSFLFCPLPVFLPFSLITQRFPCRAFPFSIPPQCSSPPCLYRFIYSVCSANLPLYVTLVSHFLSLSNEDSLLVDIIFTRFLLRRPGRCMFLLFSLFSVLKNRFHIGYPPLIPRLSITVLKRLPAHLENGARNGWSLFSKLFTEARKFFLGIPVFLALSLLSPLFSRAPRSRHENVNPVLGPFPMKARWDG